MSQPVYCPRCGQPGARVTGQEIIWTTKEPSWLLFACDGCEAAFKVRTPAGRREEIAADMRHLRYLEQHGWRPDLTDADALAMGKRIRPLYLRTRFATRVWWPLRAAGRSPAEAWEKLFSIGGRYLDPVPSEAVQP